MTQLEFAKKAIENIGRHSFHCRIYAREVGKSNYICCHYDDEIELSSEQICFLLKEQLGIEELFEGIKTEEVDIDEAIVARAVEGDWPDLGLRAKVNNTIPCELTELSEDLDLILDGEGDADTINHVREKLRDIKDDYYTFVFTIVDPVDCSYYFEDAEGVIPLTSKEAIGLLYGQYDLKEVFEGFCEEALYYDFVNDKAEKAKIVNDYCDFDYAGLSEELCRFLDAWAYIIDKILSGYITEENLNSWTENFTQIFLTLASVTGMKMEKKIN